MRVLTRACVFALWFALLAVEQTAGAGFASQILAHLRAADRAVVHGTVVYRLERHLKVPILSPEQLRRDEDKRRREWKRMGADSATIAQRLADARRTYLDMRRFPRRLRTITLVYVEGGRFKIKTHEIAPHPSVVTLYYDNRKAVRIVNREMLVYLEKPGELEPSGPMIGLAPGPCYAMGRGLSTLISPKVGRAHEGLTVSGAAADGSMIRAVLDTQRGYIATRIYRYSPRNGRLLGRWDLDGTRCVGGNVYIPTRAVYQSFGPWMSGTDRYTLLHADFRRPAEAELSVPPLQGFRISDDRLGRPVGYDKVPAGVATLDDLLPYTRKVAEDLARVQAQFERDQAKRRRVEVLIGLLFGLTALAAAAVALRSFRSLRRAGRQA